MHDTTYEQLEAKRLGREAYAPEEQLAILRGLGLELPDRAAEIEPEAREYALEFLTVLLNGAFMEVDSELPSGWTNASEQFLVYDMEVTDIESMYVDFLSGLQTISKKDLCFSAAAQDNSSVDWDEDSGTIGVDFALNGHPVHFDGAFQGDWMDLRILDAVNACLEQTGSEKRFYAAPIDQIFILFFCTADWARKFEDATLCYMTTSSKEL